MNEIIASMKQKLDMLEKAFIDLPKIQQGTTNDRLRLIDKDLRALILICLAINKK